MSKLVRQHLILNLTRSEPSISQDDLRRRLAKRGCRVNQATLSRDIHDLGLVKTTQGYVPPPSEPQTESARLPLQRLMREFVRDVHEAQNLLVFRTTVGSAQPVAAALDAEAWPGLLGTVAGDDTILVVCPDKRAAAKLANRIREILA
jgi:transcriptional regulator of arginine metabolism